MILKEGRFCPICGGLVFEVEETDSGMKLTCRTFNCDWSIELVCKDKHD